MSNYKADWLLALIPILISLGSIAMLVCGALVLAAHDGHIMLPFDVSQDGAIAMTVLGALFVWL